MNVESRWVRAQVYTYFLYLFGETFGLDASGQEEEHKHGKEERLTTKAH